MRIGLAIGVWALICTSSALAGFVDNKVKWDGMTNVEKHGYVQGWFDASRVRVYGADELNQYKDDETACVFELGFGSTQLVQIVDRKYEDLENWDKPASHMLAVGVREVCLATINRLRSSRGEAPFSK